MPAAGTTFTFTTACGEWNEEMTEFTQLFDPPFPGDRWQIDVTGVTIQEPEPPPPGDVTLSCGPATAAIGSAGMVSISLDNESAAVAGGQFAIAAEPTGQVIFGEVSATTRTEGFTVSSEESGGAQTILFYSASGETLGTGTGEILTLSFEVSQTALAGDVSLTLSGVRIADENDQPLSATLVNGSISITGGAPSKTCDYSGDGKILINDVIVFLLRARDNPDDPAVDWDGNGSYAINDAILLLLDIMKGTCPEAGALLSAIGNSEPVAVIEGLTPGDIAYIENMMEQMELTPEQEAALRLALYGEVGKAGLPKAFFLAQNSPNPFNPATMISFNLPEGASEQVSLKVFDLRGRLVRTLVDGAGEAGTYSVFWDGRDHAGRRVSSGVYLYRMQAGEFIQTRKMVLLK